MGLRVLLVDADIQALLSKFYEITYTARLTKNVACDLQPLFKHLSSYFIAGHGRSGGDWQALRVRVLKSIAQSYVEEALPESDETETTGSPLDPARLIEALEQAIALELSQSVERIREVRQFARQFENVPMEELIRRYEQAHAARSKPVRPPSTVSSPSLPLPFFEEGNDAEGLHCQHGHLAQCGGDEPCSQTTSNRGCSDQPRVPVRSAAAVPCQLLPACLSKPLIPNCPGCF